MTIQELDTLALPELKKINDRISYVPASEHPLSADMAVIKGNRHYYIFDTGSSFENLKLLYSLPDDKQVIISHFHGDHSWWLANHRPGTFGMLEDDEISPVCALPRFGQIYVSQETCRHVTGCRKDMAAATQDLPQPFTIIQKDPVTIDDGVHLEIFPLPCTHCKGSLMLTVDNEYAFLGDATYPAEIKGLACYNAQLLQQEIHILEGQAADKFVLSHDAKYIRPKKAVLRQLQAALDRWDRTGPYIVLSQNT